LHDTINAFHQQPILSAGGVDDARRWFAGVAGLVDGAHGVHVRDSRLNVVPERRLDDGRRRDGLERLSRVDTAQDDVAGEIRFGVRFPDQVDGTFA
jgi:hypothetical protein